MTSTDQFEVSVIQPTGGGVRRAARSCSTRIAVDVPRPRARRRAARAGAEQHLPADAGADRPVHRAPRRQDGPSQYVATCPDDAHGDRPAARSRTSTSTRPRPSSWPSRRGPSEASTATGRGRSSTRCRSSAGSSCRRPPSRRSTAARRRSPAQPLAPTTPDPTKYDLVRSFVDAATGSPSPRRPRSSPSTRSTSRSPSRSTRGVDGAAARRSSRFAFDDAAERADWAPNVALTPPPRRTSGPQRIRVGARAPRDAHGASPTARSTCRSPNPANAAVHVPLLHPARRLRRGEHRGSAPVRARADRHRPRSRSPTRRGVTTDERASRSPSDAPRSRRRDEGAVMFIVAMTHRGARVGGRVRARRGRDRGADERQRAPEHADALPRRVRRPRRGARDGRQPRRASPRG